MCLRVVGLFFCGVTRRSLPSVTRRRQLSARGHSKDFIIIILILQARQISQVTITTTTVLLTFSEKQDACFVHLHVSRERCSSSLLVRCCISCVLPEIMRATCAPPQTAGFSALLGFRQLQALSCSPLQLSYSGSSCSSLIAILLASSAEQAQRHGCRVKPRHACAFALLTFS